MWPCCTDQTSVHSFSHSLHVSLKVHHFVEGAGNIRLLEDLRVQRHVDLWQGDTQISAFEINFKTKQSNTLFVLLGTVALYTYVNLFVSSSERVKKLQNIILREINITKLSTEGQKNSDNIL